MAHPQPASTCKDSEAFETARVVLERPSPRSHDTFVYVAEIEEQGDHRVVATSPPFQPQVDLAAERTALAQLVTELERAGWMRGRAEPWAAIGVTLCRRRSPARLVPPEGPGEATL